MVGGGVARVPGQGKKGGVLTLIRKNPPYNIGKTDADTEGRGLTVTLNPMETISSRSITITNLYAPNIQHKQFYQSLTDWLLSYPISNHMIGGDFNLTISELEDRKRIKSYTSLRPTRSQSQDKHQSSILEDFLQHTCLIDCWRSTHPEARDCTHYSKAQNFFSRIDYFLLPTTLPGKLREIEIHGISITDHALISLEIKTH